MLGRKKVDFKGTKHGIVLFYQSELSFSELCDQVVKKLGKAKGFFKGAHMIGVDGPELSQEQEAELTNLIERLSGMKVLTLEPIEKMVAPEPQKISISFDDSADDDSDEEPKELTESLNQDEPVEPEVYSVQTEVSAPDEGQNSEGLSQIIGDIALGDKTIFHRGTLRSGKRLDSQGHLIIIGDVNPGAELYAKGNIVVIGSLRGFVYAGSDGDDARYVVALKLQPTQLRIGKWITRPPDDGHSGPSYPEIATVKQNTIIIEPIQ